MMVNDRSVVMSLVLLFTTAIWLSGLMPALVKSAHALVTPSGSEVHDVAVTDVTVFPTKIFGGGEITTNVTLENQGTSIETFNITLYVSYESFWDGRPYASGNLTILNLTITDLHPGSNVTLTLEWYVFPWRSQIWPPPRESWRDLLTANFTVRVEADVVPGEVNTANNIYVDGSFMAYWMVPDINGDGMIDMRDLAPAAAAYGSYPGHPRWNPDVDINQDGIIDMKDIACPAAIFGMTYG